MIEKRLGKIDFVEFGSMKDYPFQLGLQLGFSMSGSGVMDGGKYTVNMSPDCHWEIGTRHTNLAESLDRVAKILNDAKVNYISELSAIECGRKPVPDWFVSKLQEKYGIGDMHAQSLIKFMKERGDSDCPGTTEKTQRDILTRPPIRP